MVKVHLPLIHAVCAGDQAKAVEEMTLLVEKAEAPFRQ